MKWWIALAVDLAKEIGAFLIVALAVGVCVVVGAGVVLEACR